MVSPLQRQRSRTVSRDTWQARHQSNSCRQLIPVLRLQCVLHFSGSESTMVSRSSKPQSWHTRWPGMWGRMPVAEPLIRQLFKVFHDRLDATAVFWCCKYQCELASIQIIPSYAVLSIDFLSDTQLCFLKSSAVPSSSRACFPAKFSFPLIPQLLPTASPRGIICLMHSDSICCALLKPSR